MVNLINPNHGDCSVTFNRGYFTSVILLSPSGRAATLHPQVPSDLRVPTLRTPTGARLLDLDANMPDRARIKIGPLDLYLVIRIEVQDVKRVTDAAVERACPQDVADLPVAVEDVVAARRAGRVAVVAAGDDVREVARPRDEMVHVLVADRVGAADALEELAAV